jgi:hypothetical protein
MYFRPFNFANMAVLFLACLVSVDTNAACAFEAPQGWSQANTRWDGECVSGKANGLGVLKEYQGEKVLRFYFGKVKDGRLDIGVIDQDSGYLAGQFVNGRLQASDDRQSYVSAFNTAELAAKEAADRFDKARNKGSAQFYSQKAKELREQMD